MLSEVTCEAAKVLELTQDLAWGQLMALVTQTLGEHRSSLAAAKGDLKKAKHEFDLIQKRYPLLLDSYKADVLKGATSKLLEVSARWRQVIDVKTRLVSVLEPTVEALEKIEEKGAFATAFVQGSSPHRELCMQLGQASGTLNRWLKSFEVSGTWVHV